MSNFKSLQLYFSDPRTFVVPYYQRGYKWSLQMNPKKGKLHIDLLLSDLKSEFNKALRNGALIPHYEYYLQGITVKEDDLEIELVDGQQRTTSLFILFCVLKQRAIDFTFKLENKVAYKVRELANATLQGFINGTVAGDERVQDIAALKKAWKICEREVNDIEDLPLFSEFLLNNIKIIYIKLDKNQDEAKVFSTMNKDKAEMSQTDLIKSNILREASRQFYGEISDVLSSEGLEWQINQLRTKLAIEWDIFRKWWENEDHIAFSKMIAISPVGGEPHMASVFNLFTKFYYPAEAKISQAGIFEYFKEKIADKEEVTIEAIEVFEKLRIIQSIIGEWYNDMEIYNYLGLLFKGCGMQQQEKKLVELLILYSKNKREFVNELKKKYIIQILDDSRSKEQFIESLLSDQDVYHKQYPNVARQLLRMNVMRTLKQKQKFDFSLYEEQSWKDEDIDNSSRRSLEHIKSQTYRKDGISEEEFVELEALTNTIGNLVLVPKGLNSELSNKVFDEKKKLIFDKILTPEGKNYGLWLHTLAIFGSNTSWLTKEINGNKELFRIELTNFFNSTK